MRKAIFTLIAASVLAVMPVYGHHPFQAEFDWKKPTTLHGSVTKIEWAQPHALVTADAKDDAGVTGTWTVEMGSPTALPRYGWTQSLMKVGEKVSIDGWIAKDGSKRLNAKSVTLSNGRELFAGSSFFEMRKASDDDGS